VKKTRQNKNLERFRAKWIPVRVAIKLAQIA
jgi:hypothetical protein